MVGTAQRSPLPTRHATSGKTVRYRLQRFIDAVEALADEVGRCGLPPVGGPGEVAVTGPGDVGNVIALRRHPPQVWIALVLADLKLVHHAPLRQASPR